MTRKLLYPIKHDGRNYVPDVDPPMEWADETELSGEGDYIPGVASVEWPQGNYHDGVRVYGNKRSGQMYVPISEEK